MHILASSTKKGLKGVKMPFALLFFIGVSGQFVCSVSCREVVLLRICQIHLSEVTISHNILPCQCGKVNAKNRYAR